MNKQAKVCPLCGREYTEPPALSRADNATDICPVCGMMEAPVSYTHLTLPTICSV